MAVDVTITICLCTLLAMGRTGFEECVPSSIPGFDVTQPGRYLSTDQMILRLIFISVNTGLSSALFAFLSVLLVRIRYHAVSLKLSHPHLHLLPRPAARHISDRSHLHSLVLPPGHGVLQHAACEPQRAFVRP